MVKIGRTRALALGRALACVASLVCSCSRAVPESALAPRSSAAPARSASAQPIIASTLAPTPQRGGGGPTVTSDPPAPVAVSPELRAARDYAQRRLLRADAPLMPDLPPLGAPSSPELPGASVALEHPPGVDALAHFYSALRELKQAPQSEGGAQAVTGRKLRVAVFGASGTAQDMWTAYVRAYLQKRFGDGGPGVIAAAPHTRWYHHNELDVTGSSGWVAANPQRKPLKDSDVYGLMLVLMRGIPSYQASKREGNVISTLAPARARASDLRVARYEVWSRTSPKGGRFAISVDGEKRLEVSTRSATPGTRYDALDVEPGPHTLGLELTAKREAQLFGVVAESDRAGVVLDSLGFDGARSSAQTANDEAVWAEQMQRRAYDLYVLAYGTNEGFHDRTQPIDAAAFERDFEAMLQRFQRAAPSASCVVMQPALHDAVPEGELSPAPRIATIRPIMKRLAFEHGCAVFDGAVVEGAADGMRAWAEAGLARKDLVHFKPRGHVRFGMAVADALMRAWDGEPR